MKTGFNDLDKVVELVRGELIIVGARPAMGKSTFVQNILRNIVMKEKKSVAYFNLESPKESIVEKLMINNSKFEIDRINIEATPNITIDEICKKARDLKKDKNIELLVIDYLQLVRFDKSKLFSRDREVEEISKSLKMLAKELELPIIVTSQLSREPEKRFSKGKDPRPVLQDLRESEGLIKDAEVIMFLYRDDYYFEDTKRKNITEVIVAKNKYSSVGIVELKSLLQYAKLEDIEERIKDNKGLERVELHIHTKMSEMDGINSCKEYIEKAKELGMKALAITDHRSSTSISRSSRIFRKDRR